jgi:hypothetical protein
MGQKCPIRERERDIEYPFPKIQKTKNSNSIIFLRDTAGEICKSKRVTIFY